MSALLTEPIAPHQSDLLVIDLPELPARDVNVIPPLMCMCMCAAASATPSLALAVPA